MVDVGRASRRRVDRNDPANINTFCTLVAPHAGAWIETVSAHRRQRHGRSRLTQARGSKQQDAESCSLQTPGRASRRRVDRNYVGEEDEEATYSRASRRRVDRNLKRIALSLDKLVAPHAGAWIETVDIDSEICGINVAPHAGAWIETGMCSSGGYRSGVAPHAGAWIETTLYSCRNGL